jgi:endonuclease YncB( thermonuclease family)
MYITIIIIGLAIIIWAILRPGVIADQSVVKVQRVLDGDTVIVKKGLHKYTIRLDSIDCPEGDQYWGNIATAGLIKMIGGRSVRLEVHARDKYNRTVATVYVKDEQKTTWTNVNARMLVLGHAWVYRQFYEHLPLERRTELNEKEKWAKSKRVGLWRSSNPIPPWEWRRR